MTNNISNPNKKVGRPYGSDTYKVEYCTQMIETQKKGALLCDICSTFLISERTFYYWRDKYEDFGEAFLVGKKCSESYWANQLKQMVLKKNDAGAKACIMILNNNFGWGKDGTPSGTTNNIQINGNLNILQSKSEQELIDIIEDKLKTLPTIDVSLLENESTKQE